MNLEQDFAAKKHNGILYYARPPSVKGGFSDRVEPPYPQSSTCSGLRLSLPRSRPVARSGLGVRRLSSAISPHHLMNTYYASFLFLVIALWILPGLCQASDLPIEQGAPDQPRLSPSTIYHRNVGLGPLLLRGQSTFQLLRLSLIPTDAGNLPKGQWQVSATATWTNRWAWNPDKYLVDGEFLNVGFFLKYGVTDWMQVRLEIPFLLRGGGFMDGFVEWFHNAFGFDQMHRDQWPRDQFQIIFWRKDGTMFEMGNSDSGVGFEDMVVSTSFLVTEGGKWLPHTSIILHLKFPTGNDEELYGSGSFDFGASLRLAKRIWKFYGYLEFQYSRFGSDELAGIPMRNDQVAVLAAIEYPWTDHFSIVLQELMNTGAAKDFYQFSDPTNEITLGMKAEFLPNTFFEFGLIENLFYFDNSPDFGLHFGISRRF